MKPNSPSRASIKKAHSEWRRIAADIGIRGGPSAIRRVAGYAHASGQILTAFGHSSLYWEIHDEEAALAQCLSPSLALQTISELNCHPINSGTVDLVDKVIEKLIEARAARQAGELSVDPDWAHPILDTAIGAQLVLNMLRKSLLAFASIQIEFSEFIEGECTRSKSTQRSRDEAIDIGSDLESTSSISTQVARSMVSFRAATSRVASWLPRQVREELFSPAIADVEVAVLEGLKSGEGSLGKLDTLFLRLRMLFLATECFARWIFSSLVWRLVGATTVAEIVRRWTCDK